MKLWELFHRRVKSEIRFFFSRVFSYQCRGVLVWPEGLGDGPVADRNTRFRVRPHVDELVTTMPRLHTRLERLGSGIWTERGERFKSQNNISSRALKKGVCEARHDFGWTLTPRGRLNFKGGISRDKHPAAVSGRWQWNCSESMRKHLGAKGSVHKSNMCSAADGGIKQMCLLPSKGGGSGPVFSKFITTPLWIFCTRDSRHWFNIRWENTL